MGAGLSACNEGVRKLLMPSAGSCTRDWEGFGSPEDGSLLGLGEVRLATCCQDWTRAFFAEGLGAPADIAADTKLLQVRVGPTKLIFSTAPANSSATWPGQLYIWVADIQLAWDACRSLKDRLGREIVDEVVCCHDERAADVLLLRDPGSENVVVVNEAPKGYAEAMAAQGLASVGEHQPNMLCLMDLLCRVPEGTGARLAAFYEHFLCAKVSRTDDGCRVHFASGETMRQTLTFKEDDSELAWQPGQRGLCLYLSEVQFRIAFAKCRTASLTSCAAWEDVERLAEFSVPRCCDPGSGSCVLELEHVLRSPLHPSCPSGLRGRDVLMGA